MKGSLTGIALALMVCTGCGEAELATGSEGPSLERSKALGSGDGALWFASNVGSPDLLELFRNPESWPRSRSSVQVMQFYIQQLAADEKAQCPSCEDNIFPNLVAVDAFAKLQSWGIDIAIELGSLKHHTCDPLVAAQQASGVIEKVEAAGGKVRFIAMDEPYAGGEQVVNGESCHLGMAQSAARTAQFIQRMRQLHPDVQVGDIEPYPHYRVNQLQAWLQELANLGQTPAFFHLDVDRNYAKNLKANLTGDLRAIKNVVAGHGIPFGVIFWGHEIDVPKNSPSPDKGYYDAVMPWVRTTHGAIGRPDHAIFQSWLRSTDGRNVVPNNLSESSWGHLRLLNDGWALLSPGSPSPTPAPGGEAAKVARAYLGILGRPADPGGLAAYTHYLRSGAKTVDLARSLFASGEFTQNRSGLSAEALGTELYRGLLDREPDPSGLAGTLAEIQAGRRAERAAAMLDSAEFSQRFLGGN